MAARKPAKRSSRADGVHLIAGDKAFDSFLAEQALARVVAGAVGDDADAVQRLDGEETTWAAVLDAARTRSLFTARKAVVVRAAEALKGDEESLGGYLADPTPGVTLVLVARKLDRRRRAWKRLWDGATVHAVDPLKGQALRRYVTEAVRGRGLGIEPDGIEELLDRVGSDLRRLMGEVDKLEAFAEPRQRLGAEEVARVLGRGLARPLYLLGDAVVARDTVRTLELIDEALDAGEPGPALLGAVYRALRQIRALRSLMQARAPDPALVSGIGLSPAAAFKLPQLKSAARGWSDDGLRRAFEALRRADRRLKSSAGDARSVLALAVVEAVGADRAPRA